MARRIRVNKILSTISYIFIVIVLVGAIGAVAFLTNNFTKAPTSFIVEVNGKIIKATAEITPSKTSPTTFKVVNFSGQGYDVKIVQDVEEDLLFTYSLNGEEVYFDMCGDFTKCFNIQKNEDNFVIDFSSCNMKSLLSAYHSGSTVSDVPNIPTGKYFSLYVIDKSNSKNQVKISLLNITDIEVIGVEVQGELDVWEQG